MYGVDGEAENGRGAEPYVNVPTGLVLNREQRSRIDHHFPVCPTQLNTSEERNGYYNAVRDFVRSII